MDQLSESQSNKATKVNENFQAHLALDTFGYRVSTSSLLVWGFYGGVWNGLTIAAATVTLTASATNYIVVNRSTGAVTVATNTTNWNNLAVYCRIAVVVTNTTQPTSIVDRRLDTNGAFFISATGVPKNQLIALACSDLTTNLTTGNNKNYFVAPFDFTLVEIQASLFVAQASGALLTVDANKNGTTLMTTAKLVFDNTEQTTITAATPPVLTTTAITKGDLITVDIDQVGSALAKGLIVYFIGYPT